MLLHSRESCTGSDAPLTSSDRGTTLRSIVKVLVIGGAGYIGSHVVRQLLDESFSVTVFDNLSSGLRINFQPGAAFVHGDILRPDQLDTVMAGHDALIHLAASKAAGESMVVPEKYALNNLNGTVNILNAAVKAEISRLVFSSSAAVYGEPEYCALPPSVTSTRRGTTGKVVSAVSNRTPPTSFRSSWKSPRACGRS